MHDSQIEGFIALYGNAQVPILFDLRVKPWSYGTFGVSARRQIRQPHPVKKQRTCTDCSSVTKLKGYKRHCCGVGGSRLKGEKKL